MANKLNDPSFFKKGGLLTLAGQHTTAGKNPDGSFFIQIEGNGPTARAHLTPKQAVDLACGFLRHAGFNVDLEWKPGHA